MTDAFGIARPPIEERRDDLLSEPSVQRLVVMAPPLAREPRPVTNIAKMFGQFSELQQQIAGQLADLENSVHDQRQDVAAAVGQLPEMRERINWLIASFWEQSRKDEAVREHLNRHDSRLTALEDTIYGLCAAQTEWKSALDEVIDILLRARSIEVPAAIER
jgi:hypothetical protein